MAPTDWCGPRARRHRHRGMGHRRDSGEVHGPTIARSESVDTSLSGDRPHLPTPALDDRPRGSRRTPRGRRHRSSSSDGRLRPWTRRLSRRGSNASAARSRVTRSDSATSTTNRRRGANASRGRRGARRTCRCSRARTDGAHPRGRCRGAPPRDDRSLAVRPRCRLQTAGSLAGSRWW